MGNIFSRRLRNNRTKESGDRYEYIQLANRHKVLNKQLPDLHNNDEDKRDQAVSDIKKPDLSGFRMKNIRTCLMRVTESTRLRINTFLERLYKEEITFKRPKKEVECIKEAVTQIVNKLLNALCKEFPTYYSMIETHLVGSMAEKTSIEEPNEFDYLVEVKKLCKRVVNSYVNCVGIGCEYEGSLELFDGPMECLSDHLMKTLEVLTEKISIRCKLGLLTLPSKTVCHHGPASVVKLFWEPSTGSKPLDIFVDLTPCIAHKDVRHVVKHKFIDKYHYHQLVQDDTYMILNKTYDHFRYNSEDIYSLAFTRTEVKLVQMMSQHHKLCYMILKYSLSDLYFETCDGTGFKTYFIKTFVLKHALLCKRNYDIFICLVEILSTILTCSKEKYVKDIFNGRLLMEVSELEVIGSLQPILELLLEIGECDSPNDNIEEFKTVCGKYLNNPFIERSREIKHRRNIECHLDIMTCCHIHKEIY